MARNIVVVGIGSSAGGLEALKGLFGAMPTATGMSFIVVTHLAHARKSALSEILGRATKMVVADAEDGMELMPDHVHVAPPAVVVTVEGKRLRLRPADPDKPIRRPIDVFLGSLALSHGETAVGIILSGSGTDGTLGLKAIKERGGLTIAQGSDHSAPQHASMPDSAIAAGLVDLVLPAEAMADALVRNLENLEVLAEHHSTSRDQEAKRDQAAQARQEIYALMRERVGHDFSGYKEATFLRRVQRRMHVLEVEDLDAYVERLRQEPDEVSLLFRDLLIGVTEFFRDPDAFAALEQLVVPRLFEGKEPSDTVRVWVPGCATGEEAYSLAILLREHAEGLERPPEIKILASDINERALDVARTGTYPAALMEGVSPERKGRFFVENAGSFTIAQSVRNICTFSSHSLLRDPPFSRLDLISCRNLLIYLNADQQTQLVPLFHYALRGGGFLFLGGAEGLSRHANLFNPLDNKSRIFQRRDHVSAPVRFWVPGQRLMTTASGPSRDTPAGGLLRRAVETRVLERFAPAHVVVNADGNVVHYSMRTGNYLEAPSGQPSQHLLLLARKELRLDLRAALQEAVETRRPARRERIAVNVGRDTQLVDIVVEPLPEPSPEPLFLVVFADAGPPFGQDTIVLAAAASDSGAERLEQELRDTRERLQAVIEEHETGIEELKSGNEELIALNEELQSTNEELETNAEEIQSVNEELNTVNAELTRNIEQLNQTQNDLRNVVDSTRIALVFLDRKLRIRSFTAAAASLFSLLPSDCGRPLSDITHRLDDDDLDQAIRAALTGNATIERRVTDRDGNSCYLLRILPYHNAGGATEGVTVTLVEIDILVEAERQMQNSVEELHTRVRQQGAVADFGAKALRANDLDALLHEASDVVATCLGIQRAKVLQLLPDRDRLLIRAGVGWDPDVVGKVTIGADEKSPAGVALQTGEAVVSEDLEEDARFDVPKVLRDHGIKSAVNVLIRGETAPFGVLEVDSQEHRQFGPDDINFLQSCSNLVAAAIDRLRNEAKLERALEEKQVLLYELQHRVKNSLQEMSALVNIERRKVHDPSMRRALEVLGARLEALRVIYRKLYLVDHHTEIDLGDYLGELSGDLFAFHGIDPQAIDRELHLSELKVTLDHALPLGLIACEFIVNSLKHAFPEGQGKITLALEPVDDDHAKLILGDNGAGLQEAGNPGNGSGLQLIRRLVDQIGGKLDLAGLNGVTMTVVFPLNRQAHLN